MFSYERNDPFTRPRIHGLVFDPKDGILKRQDIDFKSVTRAFGGLYDLHVPDTHTKVHRVREPVHRFGKVSPVVIEGTSVYNESSATSKPSNTSTNPTNNETSDENAKSAAGGRE